MRSHHDKEQLGYAEDLMTLIVQAILITTPVGFLLTNYLGPWLLKKTDSDIGEYHLVRCEIYNVAIYKDNFLCQYLTSKRLETFNISTTVYYKRSAHETFKNLDIINGSFSEAKQLT